MESHTAHRGPTLPRLASAWLKTSAETMKGDEFCTGLRGSTVRDKTAGMYRLRCEGEGCSRPRRLQVLQLLLELAREGGKTVVMVTHDPDSASRMQRTIDLATLRRHAS